jgi:DNA-binding GntR family transcriptional regulator
MMPVREAVSRLVADGALEVTPNRAVRVPVLTSTQFRDLTRVRIAVEGHAAAQAAECRTGGDLARITVAERAFRDQSRLAAPDLALAVGLNKDFHFAVYAAAGSPLMVDIIRALWLKAGPVINLDLRANAARLSAGGAVRFHADALAAIRTGDAAAARAAVAGDIAGASDFILARGSLPD